MARGTPGRQQKGEPPQGNRFAYLGAQFSCDRAVSQVRKRPNELGTGVSRDDGQVATERPARDAISNVAGR